ncbi:hypothetical protein ACFL0M_04695 [Thermodesulfobacteriota bacterium]
MVVAVEVVRWIDTSGRKPGRHATQYDTLYSGKWAHPNAENEKAIPELTG